MLALNWQAVAVVQRLVASFRFVHETNKIFAALTEAMSVPKELELAWRRRRRGERPAII